MGGNKLRSGAIDWIIFSKGALHWRRLGTPVNIEWHMYNYLGIYKVIWRKVAARGNHMGSVANGSQEKCLGVSVEFGGFYKFL